VLGAAIRLGEAVAGRSPVDAGRKLSERLGELETRLLSLEGESGAANGSNLDVEERQQETSSNMSLQLRRELREWMEETVTARMADLELRLQAESEHGRKQMLDAFAESVQTRVIQRISRLEEEVAGQSAAMSELRECSLRTEQSVQKLLGGLDKLVVRRPPAPEEAVIDSPSADPAGPQPEPPAFAPQLKAKRWKIFG
jgi:hypothetical protein